MRFLMVLGLLLQSISAFAEPYKLLSHTRETDYTIGSVARQHLEIELPLGYRLDEGSLPEKGVTEAVELRDMHWQFEDEKKSTHYTFEIDWQIFLAFDTVKSIQLRNLTLVFKRENKSLSIEVPADSVLVSNLLPPKMDVQHVQPYADVMPMPINITPMVLTLLCSIMMLLATFIYIAWYFGWITFSAEKSMPFRQAWRAIKKINADELNVTNALQIMSRAFNQYAGYAVTTENLPTLLAERVDLKSASLEINQLYHAIQLSFFAGQSPTYSLNEIKKLAKQLSKLELS